MTTTWREVWRRAAAPELTTGELEALRDGLARGDPALLHGATTDPPPLKCAADLPVCGACLLAYCGWKGAGKASVAEVETYFADLCERVDRRGGEAAYCRTLLDAWDEEPRGRMRRDVLAEVKLALAAREGGASC